MPQFNDFEIDLNEKEVVMMSHLSPIQQVRGHDKSSGIRRTVSLMMSVTLSYYAYKMDDMAKEKLRSIFIIRKNMEIRM